MIIDEAIAFCEEKANNIKLKAEPQVFIQLAEWLEELKEYRNTNLNPSMVKDLVRSEKKAHRIALENAEKIDSYVDEFEKNVRNKAIDDFVRMAKEIKYQDGSLSDVDLEYIAEQLKERVENE